MGAAEDEASGGRDGPPGGGPAQSRSRGLSLSPCLSFESAPGPPSEIGAEGSGARHSSPSGSPRGLAVGAHARLNARGEARFRGRDTVGNDLLLPGEVGVVTRLGRQQSGTATAHVRCPRGGCHLYWRCELELAAEPSGPEAAERAAAPDRECDAVSPVAARPADQFDAGGVGSPGEAGSTLLCLLAAADGCPDPAELGAAAAPGPWTAAERASGVPLPQTPRRTAPAPPLRDPGLGGGRSESASASVLPGRSESASGTTAATPPREPARAGRDSPRPRARRRGSDIDLGQAPSRSASSSQVPSDSAGPFGAPPGVHFPAGVGAPAPPRARRHGPPGQRAHHGPPRRSRRAGRGDEAPPGTPPHPQRAPPAGGTPSRVRVHLAAETTVMDVSAVSLRDRALFESGAGRSADLSRALSELSVEELAELVRSPRTAQAVASIVGRAVPMEEALQHAAAAPGAGYSPRRGAGSPRRPPGADVPVSGTAAFCGPVFDAAAAALGAACAERARLRRLRAVHELRSEEVRQCTDLSALRPRSLPRRCRTPPKQPLPADLTADLDGTGLGSITDSRSLTRAVRDETLRRFLRQRLKQIMQERNLEALKQEENRRLARTFNSIARKNMVAEGVSEYRERWARLCRRAADAEAVRREQLRDAEYYARCAGSSGGAERAIRRAPV